MKNRTPGFYKALAIREVIAILLKPFPPSMRDKILECAKEKIKKRSNYEDKCS